MRNPLDFLRSARRPIENAGLRRLRRSRFKRLVLTVGAPAVILIAILVVISWYSWSLRPLDGSDSNHVRVTIASGTRAPDIAAQLVRAHIIRSKYAFEIYTRLSGNENKLRAGTYAFAPNESVGNIVDDLAQGKTGEFSITILPGQTIADIKTMLEGHGYTPGEISAALNANYTNKILQSRGAQNSLEGFLYPDTYNVLSDEALTTVFGRIFDHFSTVLDQNNLTAGFAAHGLSTYQGITLASIVQREVSSPEDQRKVASVFYNRLDSDMALGSDVTFIYGAGLLGVTPTPSLDSPYNLRINKGLTPTPIGSPSLSALQAVANPDKTNYLFFVAGDDGKTYFATTNDEHEQNIKLYCKVKCQ